MKSHCLPALLLAAGLLLSGCSVKDPNHPKFVVAKGKDFTITKAQLDKEMEAQLKMMGLSPDKIPPQMLGSFQSRMLDQLITKEILTQAAKNIKVPDLDKKIDEEIARYREAAGDEASFAAQLKEFGMTEAQVRQELRKQLTVEEFIKARSSESEGSASDEEIQAFYKENPEYWKQPEQARASHILVRVEPGATPAEKTAKKKIIDDARARVQKGEDFAKVAAEVSEDPGSKNQGGDLGSFGRGQMVPPFEKAAFGQPIGAIGPVFTTDYGYHFVKVTSRTPARTVPYDEVKERIGSHLSENKQRTQFEAVVKELREKADVKIFLPEPETTAVAMPEGLPGGEPMPLPQQ
jgi:peptidyl-prolyl cis-trans isomerase C